MKDILLQSTIFKESPLFWKVLLCFKFSVNLVLNFPIYYQRYKKRREKIFDENKFKFSHDLVRVYVKQNFELDKSQV